MPLSAVRTPHARAKKPGPSVPKLWAGETAVCIGGGSSLTRDDVEYCRGKARVVAVNDAYRLAPWADVLYAADASWWYWHKGVPSFTGPKYTLDTSARYKGLTILENMGLEGLETDPRGLRNGRNGGYQAIGLAYHLGITRILLLGYDMHGGHWFGDHPGGHHRQPSPFNAFIRYFATIARPLEAAGVEVINCTLGSRLACFPKRPLREVL